MTRSKTWLQPIDFFFFLLKRRCFDLKKNQKPVQNPTRCFDLKQSDPVTRLKSETRALDRDGFKNYD